MIIHHRMHFIMKFIRLILLFFIVAANAHVNHAAPLIDMCPLAPTARLRVGMVAVVYADGLNLRALPAVDTGVNAQLYNGNALTIVGGPSCNGHYNWWRVELPNGRRGWIAEATWETFYVIPQARQNVRVPTPLEWSCLPQFRTRLCYTAN